MPRSLFTGRALARVIRAGDPARFAVDLKNDRQAILETAAEQATNGHVSLKKCSFVKVRGKACASYGDFHAHLVLRSLAQYIERRYRVAIPDRDKIVRGVLEGLLDSTPMYILRRDIKSFYESVPIQPVRDRLLHDTAIPERAREYLKEYFDVHCKAADHGLPRGVGLSAILVELAMEPFDQQIWKIPGVYKYYRFSDDIIIFSYLPLREIATQVEACLSPPMVFNLKKKQDVIIDEVDKTSSSPVEFEYLGYCFVTSNVCGKEDSRRVCIEISQRKINKIKSRIVLSLKSYSRSRDFRLLYDRIAYASSNFSVRRKGFAVTGRSRSVKSGIYYNYRQCGTYEFRKKRFRYSEHEASEIKRLDGFWFELLHSRQSPFRSVLDSNLSGPQMRALTRLSFYKGFTDRIVVRFQPDRIRQIKAAWLNV